MPRRRGEQQRDTSTPSPSFLAREESEVATETPSLEGWSITRGAEGEWIPWGNDDNARAKLLGTDDGYVLALVEAQAGYRGAPHERAHAEFLFVVNGTIRNQGEILMTGDGYAAGAVRPTTTSRPSRHRPI
jgi:hypothetical protein